MPWFDQVEISRFRSLTIGATLVMGHKTYQANLPWMRGNRKVVLSRDQDLYLPDALVFNTITQLAQACPDAWVVGGPMTLSAFLPYTKYMFLTKFPHAVQGDHWMPDIQWSLWQARGKTESHGRELVTLERRTLARAQPRPDSPAAPAKRKDEAKKA